jgi:hypothetical protein
MPLKSTTASLAVEARSRGNAYDLYRTLGDAMRQRYIERVRALDPDLGSTHTMHNAHNWHRATRTPKPASAAIVTLLDRQQRVSAWISARAQTEHYAVEHRIHLQERRAGAYLWCPGCTAYREEQATVRQPRLLSAPLAKRERARP